MTNRSFGLAYLKAAKAMGYTFTVICEGEIDYRGPNPLSAWEAVKATGEANVRLTDSAGKRIGTAYLIHGSVDPDEEVADYSISDAMEYLYANVN